MNYNYYTFSFVATALTVYGIETSLLLILFFIPDNFVATALTVYGIETLMMVTAYLNNIFVATALTVYGIETTAIIFVELDTSVATVLTVYGIETSNAAISSSFTSCNSTYRLRY